MSLKLTTDDHKAMDTFLARMLDAYKDGEADRDTVVGVLAHAMAAAALDEEGQFKAYIRLSNEALLED